MTTTQDPIAHAARLLREAAEELRQAHAYHRSEGWQGETGAQSAYDVYMAAAQALEAEAAPQQEAQEPAMIYHGRCTIDCGEGGHHDMEMLRMIPAGSKLYTAPQPAPAPLSERDAFERDWEKRHAPVPINGRTHDDGRYGDSSIQDAWESWQARAALAAQGGQ